MCLYFYLKTKGTILANPVQMAKKHMKVCSVSLVLRERRIQTTVRYTVTLMMAMIKKDDKYW